MTRRIEAISSYIENNELVIDVGCDQAKLSILLAKRGIHSIASDLKENIIENAKKNTPNYLKEYITFRVGDGITLTNEENNYTLVMAGMGSHLMINLLKKTKKTFNKIITISNNNHDILRCEFLNLGYIVSKEEIIKERKKYYNLIVFMPGKKVYSKEELLIGVNHQNIDLLKERNKTLIGKYTKILETIKDKNKIKELEEKIKILTSSL